MSSVQSAGSAPPKKENFASGFAKGYGDKTNKAALSALQGAIAKKNPVK